MRKENTCCFSGHRHISYALKDVIELKLKEKVAELYLRGVRNFISGGAIGFDLLAAEEVLSLRSVRPDVRLIMALPCLNQSEKWSAQQRSRYDKVLCAADELIYLSEEYTRGCMYLRNRFMVNSSSVCLCWCAKSEGGTAYTVSYAEKQGLKIYNLAD